MTIDFKLRKFFAFAYVGLTTGNVVVSALLGTPAWITVDTQVAYTFCIACVWVALGSWLRDRVKEADHATQISAVTFDGLGASSVAWDLAAQDAYGTRETPSRTPTEEVQDQR